MTYSKTRINIFANNDVYVMDDFGDLILIEFDMLINSFAYTNNGIPLF